MSGVVEQYSLESLKEMWSEYIKDHDMKGEILDAAADYPERQHIDLEYHDIAKFNVELAEHVLENPRASFMALEMAVQEAQPPSSRVPLRAVVTTLPEDNAKRPVDLRVADMGHLAALKCMVSNTEEPTGRYRVAVFQCMRCGAIHRIDQTTPGKRKEPVECYKENNGCQRPASSTKFRCLSSISDLPDPFLAAYGERDVHFSEMVDEQWLDVQDTPDSMRGNEMPAVLRARVEGSELVRKANVGDTVTMYGVLRVDDGKGSVSPTLYFDANHVENRTQEMLVVTDGDRDRLKALVRSVKDPLSELLVPSLAPHVYGLDGPKHGIMCMLLGGLDGKVGSKTLRWMMHILLVGDPGTGKSQLLQHISKMVPRASYVDAGKASRAGLVAKAVQENGKWVAKPGYVARSNGSVCCVDELNKMEADDIAMLNGAMESGIAAIAKAGTGEFPAETAILAAMNPETGGRYTGDFHGEVKIEGATLDRFALIYIIEDKRQADEGLQGLIRPYYTEDTKVEADGNGLLSMEDMRKFMAIARPLRPKLTPAAAKMVEEQHTTLRNADDSSWSNRVLEDLYRLSASVAKSRLSETATVDDVKKAIDIHAMAAWGEVHSVGETGSGSQMDKHTRMYNLMAQLDGDDPKEGLTLTTIAREASDFTVEQLQIIIKRLSEDGRIIEIRHGVWKVVR